MSTWSIPSATRGLPGWLDTFAQQGGFKFHESGNMKTSPFLNNPHRRHLVRSPICSEACRLISPKGRRVAFSRPRPSGSGSTSVFPSSAIMTDGRQDIGEPGSSTAQLLMVKETALRCSGGKDDNTLDNSR